MVGLRDGAEVEVYGDAPLLIVIGPDHTPPWVTVRQNPRTGSGWFAGAGGAVIFSGGMAVTVEMHHTGCVPAVRSEIVALIEHVLSDGPGIGGF